MARAFCLSRIAMSIVIYLRMSATNWHSDNRSLPFGTNSDHVRLQNFSMSDLEWEVVI